MCKEISEGSTEVSFGAGDRISNATGIEGWPYGWQEPAERRQWSVVTGMFFAAAGTVNLAASALAVKLTGASEAVT